MSEQTKYQIRLPDKPSAFIRVALEDLKKVERDRLSCVDMTSWHSSYDDGSCSVCLGGAVLWDQLPRLRNQTINPTIIADFED